jgi:hypothetical protein
MWTRECVWVKSAGRTQIAQLSGYFVRQRGRLSPAFFVQVSLVPVDDFVVEPAGEQY